jgi:hypothetical protein
MIGRRFCRRQNLLSEWSDEMEQASAEQAGTELGRLQVAFDQLTLLQAKAGIAVWRVHDGAQSWVLKLFKHAEDTREISNYALLQSLGIPTLKVLAQSERAIVMEDIARAESTYRLGVETDMADVQVAAQLAQWYKALHTRGAQYDALAGMYDESDLVTADNMRAVALRSGTMELPVWRILEEHEAELASALHSLPRTLTYNDFYYVNLAVAREGSAALMFDYNLLGKGYVYSDLRNVCTPLSTEAAETFLAAYGYDASSPAAVFERDIDEVTSTLLALHVAYGRAAFPPWAQGALAKLRSGELEEAVRKLLRIL